MIVNFPAFTSHTMYEKIVKRLVMKPKVMKTALKDLSILEIDRLEDKRGYFTETWSKEDFVSVGLDLDFVQENHSGSKQSVLRGLHYQDYKAPLVKLVRCILGEIFDVAVDLRVNSKTFGKWFGLHLTAENRKQLYVPIGFAHGFAVLSEYAEVIYKQTGYYTPSSEGTILWSDRDLAIDWPIKNPLLSEKDANGKTLKEYLQNPAFK